MRTWFSKSRSANQISGINARIVRYPIWIQIQNNSVVRLLYLLSVVNLDMDPCSFHRALRSGIHRPNETNWSGAEFNELYYHLILHIWDKIKLLQTETEWAESGARRKTDGRRMELQLREEQSQKNRRTLRTWWIARLSQRYRTYDMKPPTVWVCFLRALCLFPRQNFMAILKSGWNIVPDPAAQMYTDPSGSGSATMYFLQWFLFFIFGNRSRLFWVVVNLKQLAYVCGSYICYG